MKSMAVESKAKANKDIPIKSLADLSGKKKKKKKDISKVKGFGKEKPKIGVSP